MIKGLAYKLKKLRLIYGLSQKQVAEKLGMSPSIVSAYETGERTPSLDILLAISYLYNCKTDYLLRKQQDTPKLRIDTNGLNEEQIRAINKLIETIKNQPS